MGVFQTILAFLLDPILLLVLFLPVATKGKSTLKTTLLVIFLLLLQGSVLILGFFIEGTMLLRVLSIGACVVKLLAYGGYLFLSYLDDTLSVAKICIIALLAVSEVWGFITLVF